jgi:hypothetical protein
MLTEQDKNLVAATLGLLSVLALVGLGLGGNASPHPFCVWAGSIECQHGKVAAGN